MPSPTQRQLTRKAVLALVAGALPDALDARPLDGGGYAAVWRVDTPGRSLVLKVAPPVGTPVLRYERGLVAAEADYFTRVRQHDPSAPVPHVVARAADDTWLLTTFLDGEPLPALDDRGLDTGGVRRALGATMARVHAATGDCFGYTGDRASAHTWPAAFRAIMADLLADAADFGVDLGVPAADIRAAVDAGADALAAVTRPAVVHVDLWDGNVLATPTGTGAARLSGLVDGERWMYGDPLVDFVSPALFRRIEDEPHHPFVAGYRAATRDDLLADAAARHRLRLYRLHLALVMLAEVPSRGGSTDPGDEWFRHLRGQLARRLADVS